jgi:dTDP-4-dehydrorhamnose reductase
VAQVAQSLGVPIVHLSTDFVFDGSLERPYRESDPTRPLGQYGLTKLAGENRVAAATSNHAILRTSWVYSPFGKNFVRTMLTIARDRDEVSVVDDQLGTPTNALDIADGILSVASNLVNRPDDPALRGIFHMTGHGETTWAGFASQIFSLSKDLGGPFARVNPIPSSAYPTAARRPANSRLDNEKIAGIHGINLPNWEQSLANCVRKLVPSEFKD